MNVPLIQLKTSWMSFNWKQFVRHFYRPNVLFSLPFVITIDDNFTYVYGKLSGLIRCFSCICVTSLCNIIRWKCSPAPIMTWRLYITLQMTVQYTTMNLWILLPENMARQQIIYSSEDSVLNSTMQIDVLSNVGPWKRIGMWSRPWCAILSKYISSESNRI